MQQGRVVSDECHLVQELNHLGEVFRQNVYAPHEISWALNKDSRPTRTEEDGPTSFVVIPFHGTVSCQLSHLLHRFWIWAVFHPPTKIQQMIGSVKNDLRVTQARNLQDNLLVKHKLFWGKSHIIADCCKQHVHYICLNYPDKSAPADHCISWGHQLDFQSLSVLLTTTNYRKRLVTEAIEIQIQNNTFNRDI